MKKYEKPEAISLSTSAEGIFMASGDTLKTCRFGRTEASAGSDTCQECSKSAGLRSTPLPGEESARKSDFKKCVDHLPIKDEV